MLFVLFFQVLKCEDFLNLFYVNVKVDILGFLSTVGQNLNLKSTLWGHFSLFSDNL